MHGPTKELDSAPSNSIYIPRKYGPLLVIQQTGTLSGKQIDRMAKQIDQDTRLEQSRNLAEIAIAARVIDHGDLPPGSILHRVGIDYTEVGYDVPDSKTAQKIRGDLLRLLSEGYVALSRDRFSITQEGNDHAKEKTAVL